MQPISLDFRDLCLQDAPKTRARIYFIGDAVDCADDNDVQTNGTLLVGAPGDTDSNGRIAAGGITFEQFFNKEKNITVGDVGYSQISMTLLNYDGALDGFAYGRCKVYLDVYDTANSTWVACPMGVFIIEQPTLTKKNLIAVTGFDQSQKLEQIADDWWAAIDWSVGLTWEDIVDSMASYIGVQSIPNYGGTGANETIVYTSAPFECIEKTFRDILKYIGDFSGTNAYFDRNGKLCAKAFNRIQYPDSGDVIVFAYGNRNQCLSIDVSAYTVDGIDTLTLKNADEGIEITSGVGNQKYALFDNPLFTHGVSNDPFVPDTTQQRVDYTLGSLQQVSNYIPIQGTFIWEWDIDAGDIVFIEYGGEDNFYTMPIFQQKMVWRGGFVISTVESFGDKVRPVATAPEREDYQFNKRLAECVKTEGNRAYFDEFQISANSSVNVPFANGQKGLIVLSGGANTKEIVIVNATTAGVVTRVSVTSNSNYTYTTSTRNLNIANGTANAVQGIVLYF